MMHIWEEAAEVATCKQCKLSRNLATYDCPEEPVPPEQLKQIEAGALDYRDGKWRTYMKL